ARTDLTAELVSADALEWAPGAPFDAILLDAPCSATGTIRRHPDVPHLRASLDLKPFVEVQDALLDRAAAWLAPGGRLVYATCSLLPEEGEQRAAALLQRESGLAPLPPEPERFGIPPDWLDSAGNLRTRPDFWPDSGGLDGFFAASFIRRT
ncbi:MAG: 16S rRNA methyltransferase, partial [Pseudomonadota bacterium]